MTVKHYNEPRDLAYSKKNAHFFKVDEPGSWTHKGSTTIFAGKNQKDLFIFAMALGKNRQSKQTEVKDRQANIPVVALNERQKWTLLSIALANTDDLLCLKDENPHYKEAESYAEEGINILKAHIEKYGINYPKFLEAELKDILKNSDSTGDV
ncbi:hypothetical protein J2T58_001380 [Methanocalculus alkaliphilus]|uniref:hypothetical protein n=1 Tax=Methanocalculus alkaliphilus TaxID=768730 RepID=UPI0020A19C15|nr:hypothetical protein [Methanocalculus alkaliphilus]MCP1715515.1 hypothetical protein [Methanocalculus alkaliphilus]